MVQQFNMSITQVHLSNNTANLHDSGTIFQTDFNLNFIHVISTAVIYAM